MELLLMVALGVLLFMGVRVVVRRQAQRMNDRIESQITPENARIAVLQLDDDQHREIYKAIAAEDGRHGLTLYRQFTGASVQDCLIAIQSLHKYPQPAPSEIRMEEEFGDVIPGQVDVEEDASVAGDTQDSSSEEYVEDVIDGVRSDSEHLEDGVESRTEPANSTASSVQDPELDDQARKMIAESGFDAEGELTIPEEWANSDEEMAGFHLEVRRGEEKVTLSHEDLEPWVHDQLYALLRDDRVDEAATLLSHHSPLTYEESREFLAVFKNQG